MHKGKHGNQRIATGFTLIEMLIAMVIGLALAAGVIKIYVDNTQTERIQKARARMQENGRFALNFLTQEIRMAGYPGCLCDIESSQYENTLEDSPPTFQPVIGIQGWEAAGTAPGEMYNSVNNVAVTSTDGGGWIATAGTVLDSTMAMPGTDIIKIWSAADGSASIDFVASGELVQLQGISFYIGKRGNVATNPSALFRRESNATAVYAAQELIEGVESMQILYGLNLDNDYKKTVGAYVSANLVENWASVVSVRVSLLIQSVEDSLVASPQPYTFNGVVYDGSAGNGSLPADRRLRRVFTSTITLRNRAMGR